MGKHIDKAPWDAPKHVNTIPVLLGEYRARRATQVMMIAFYVLVPIFVIAGALPWPSLLAFVALPQLGKVLRAFEEPRPEQAPPRWPIWPLWFAPIAFVHTRRAGALFVLGLAIGAIIRAL